MNTQMSSFLKEKISKQVAELKAQNKSNEEINAFVFNFYKNFSHEDIAKILKALNKKYEPKKEKKVNKIDPSDPRVEGMQLGEYKHFGLGTYVAFQQNKFFWQCVKCNEIFNSKSAAEDCNDMHDQIFSELTSKEYKVGDSYTFHSGSDYYPVSYKAIVLNVEFDHVDQFKRSISSVTFQIKGRE